MPNEPKMKNKDVFALIANAMDWTTFYSCWDWDVEMGDDEYLLTVKLLTLGGFSHEIDFNLFIKNGQLTFSNRAEIREQFTGEDVIWREFACSLFDKCEVLTNKISKLKGEQNA